ncbi:MAG: chemotaxis protein CheB [Pedobacter sp.]|jgi:two-component system chemotaxis response regulator CheB|nr:MAG: chemotaxis protein CheB [Pedobacter sp.]
MSNIKINHTYSHVVVIGASAGGLDALVQLASQFGPEFPAPVLIVQHISPDASGNVLLSELRKTSKLECKHAVQGESIKAGCIYLAPSDHHLLVHGDGRLQVTRGAQENRYRPSIDPLFRSAAVGFGNRLIGVILTGYLDDGTSGMVAIQRCGGKCIIQDPEDAKYPDMPLNAINQLDADYILPVSEMGSVLLQLTSATIKAKKNVAPKDILVEAKIAERILSDLDAVNSLGEQVPFNCPGCGGVLWKIGANQELRYRCHTGHAYTYKSLLAEQTSKIEETMWTALRMFEERRNLLITYSKTQHGAAAKSSLERSKSSQIHIDRIRAILFTDDNDKGND